MVAEKCFSHFIYFLYFFRRVAVDVISVSWMDRKCESAEHEMPVSNRSWHHHQWSLMTRPPTWEGGLGHSMDAIARTPASTAVTAGPPATACSNFESNSKNANNTRETATENHQEFKERKQKHE
jgi:hypothetical protein